MSKTEWYSCLKNFPIIFGNFCKYCVAFSLRWDFFGIALLIFRSLQEICRDLQRSLGHQTIFNYSIASPQPIKMEQFAQSYDKASYTIFVHNMFELIIHHLNVPSLDTRTVKSIPSCHMPATFTKSLWKQQRTQVLEGRAKGVYWSFLKSNPVPQIFGCL